MSGQLQIRADLARNRLYLKLSGFFRGQQVEPAMRELTAALQNLRLGFDVITDLTEFVPGSPAATEALKKGGESIKRRGRRNAVRITGGLVTGLMQFRRLLGVVFDEESVRYAKSMEEAEAILDNWSDPAPPVGS